MEPAFDREEDPFDLGEDPVEGENEIPHADERWLVSYADMMTLLFGFFVLLYAMSDKFDVIQKSASKEFNSPGQEQKKAAEPVAAEVKSDATFNALQEERGKLVVRVKELEMDLKHALADADAGKKSAAELEELREKVRELSGKVALSKETEKENSRLRAEVAVKDIPPPSAPPKPEAPEPRAGKPAGQEGKAEVPGGNTDIKFSLVAELPGGGTFEARVLRISITGLQLSEVPPDSLGQNFKVRLRRDDGQGAIDLMAYAAPGPNGQRTRRLSILDFPNGDEQVLRGWFKQMQKP